MTRNSFTRPFQFLIIALTVGLTIPRVAPAAPVAGVLVREAVEMAFKKGSQEAVERVSREAVQLSVEAGVAKYGPRAAQAVVDGGLELVEASAEYGDDVMRAAVEATPLARRALALRPREILPLVRELGTEAAELEAMSPGLARRVFASFGDDGARQIARQVPAEDLPRLLAYAEKADTPETRRVLLQAYEKEGPAFFERIPPKLVLASGLSVATIYGVHRLTAPMAAAGDAIRDKPEAAGHFLDGVLWVFFAVAMLATVFILASFRLTPWHAARQASQWSAGTASTTPEANA